MSHDGRESRLDPVVAAYLEDVDRMLLRENQRLTPDERIRKMQNFVRVLGEMREVGRRLNRPVLPELIAAQRNATRPTGNEILAELQALLEERTRTDRQ